MPPPWITPSDVLARIADDLDKPVNKITANWTSKVRDAIEFASNEIVMLLARMGYSSDQMDAWDRNREYSLAIALWWVYTRGNVPRGTPDGDFKPIDRRPELTVENPNFMFTIAGVPQFPASANDPNAMTGFAISGRVSADRRVVRNIHHWFNNERPRPCWPWRNSGEEWV